MTEQEKVEYQRLIEPLAKFLASKHINDEIHKYVVADIYDVVNDIRDKLIKQGMTIIWKLQASRDFYVNPHKRTQVLELQRAIRGLQGVPKNDEPSAEPVQGDLPNQSEGEYMCWMF